MLMPIDTPQAFEAEISRELSNREILQTRIGLLATSMIKEIDGTRICLIAQI
jgi:hypothetical protein